MVCNECVDIGLSSYVRAAFKHESDTHDVASFGDDHSVIHAKGGIVEKKFSRNSVTAVVKIVAWAKS